MADPQLALFSQYEQNYCKHSSNAANSIEAVKALSDAARFAEVKKTEQFLKDAEEQLRALEMETRMMASPQYQRECNQKCRDYKDDLKKLKTDLNQAKMGPSSGNAARDALGLDAEYGGASAAQRNRMLTATQMLNRTSDRIQQGQASLAQTEEIGVQIMQDLHAQRDTIQRAQGTLHSADDNIGKARKVLSSMARRVTQNKMIMYLVMFLLAMGIILIIYFNSKK